MKPELTKSLMGHDDKVVLLLRDWENQDVYFLNRMHNELHGKISRHKEKIEKYSDN